MSSQSWKNRFCRCILKKRVKHIMKYHAQYQYWWSAEELYDILMLCKPSTTKLQLQTQLRASCQFETKEYLPNNESTTMYRLFIHSKEAKEYRRRQKLREARRDHIMEQQL